MKTENRALMLAPIALLITLFLAIPLAAKAQVNDLNTLSSQKDAREARQSNDWEEEPPKGTPGLYKNRFFTGGGLGLQFGTLTAVELAPTVGYIVHRMFRFGITVNFSYFRDAYFQPALSSYYWGGSFFVRFYPIRRLFIHAEIGGMNQPYGTDHERRWLAYPIAGQPGRPHDTGHVELQQRRVFHLRQSHHRHRLRSRAIASRSRILQRSRSSFSLSRPGIPASIRQSRRNRQLQYQQALAVYDRSPWQPARISS